MGSCSGAPAPADSPPGPNVATSYRTCGVNDIIPQDFISRLRAPLNIKGIDEKIEGNDKNEGEKRVSDLLALRRAILLRSILENRAKGIFDNFNHARIDKPLITAFLRVVGYEHGIRSMEAIVEMSRPEKGYLLIASLPSPDQLRMHVNVEQFLSLAKPESSAR